MINALDLAYIPLAALTAPWWARKARSGWRSRFGFGDTLATPARPRILLHAVSVGEVSAARALVPLLAQEADVVVSATTDAGLARAMELYGQVASVVRFPLDFSWSVHAFLDRVQPTAVALVELELWPNFLHECSRRKIPVCVINGRLSERSFRGYRRFRPLVTGMFRQLAFAGVQDEAYAARFEAMGVRPGDCLITGSMKWDSFHVRDRVEGDDALARELGIDRSRPILVAGSTGPGEEELLHASCPPGVQLVCAPRKPERFDEAARALPGCVRRSSRAPGTSDRYLLDTIGELARAYSLADLVVLGRSFFDLHGSDPCEPAGLAKPLVTGPRFGDFSTAVDALRDAGGITVVPREGLRSALSELIADEKLRVKMGRAAQECVRSHQGATPRHAELVLSLAGVMGRDR